MTAPDDAKADLRTHLQEGRDVLMFELDGLSDHDVRRPMTPTGTNLLGLLKHLAYVEMGYFGPVFGPRVPEVEAWMAEEGEPNADMWATPEESRADVVALYRRAWASTDDTFDGERRDLEPYLALAGQLGAGSVLDIGCGTGTFACLLAARGIEVTGVDPAAASLEVARRKPHGERVRWVHGDAAASLPLQVDLVTMTANVAQVFLDDADWAATLSAARTALRPGGRLVLESRRPERRAWLEWDRERSLRHAVVPGAGAVETWVEVTDVRDGLVSFRWTFVFERDGAVVTSDSTLRFRSRAELTDPGARGRVRRGGRARGAGPARS